MREKRVWMETWGREADGWRLVRRAETPLQKELREMVRVDQEARTRVIAAPKDAAANAAMAAVDTRNLGRLKQINSEGGWPDADVVGSDGAHNAWLLVQHADQEPAFQKACLKRIARSVKHGNASAADAAYLTDRVLTADGKKQRFGTQFMYDARGELVPRPIEGDRRVDERRRKIGLAPMAEYREMLLKMYHPREGAAPKPQPSPSQPSGQ